MVFLRDGRVLQDGLSAEEVDHERRVRMAALHLADEVPVEGSEGRADRHEHDGVEEARSMIDLEYPVKAFLGPHLLHRRPGVDGIVDGRPVREQGPEPCDGRIVAVPAAPCRISPRNPTKGRTPSRKPISRPPGWTGATGTGRRSKASRKVHRRSPRVIMPYCRATASMIGVAPRQGAGVGRHGQFSLLALAGLEQHDRLAHAAPGSPSEAT